MCGEQMMLKESHTTVRVPGNPGAIAHTVKEWICPDCDYFEEAEEEGS